MSHLFIRIFQKRLFHAKNDTSPQFGPLTREIGSLYTFHRDVQYPSEFPNNFMDLYIRKDASGNPVPTVIFIHGGGYTWGDKHECAPDLSGAIPERDWFARSLVEAGYNVVCMNYALAPDYPYFTPVLQIASAVRFLLDNAAVYHLDMSRIVFAGNSAGAQLAGQYVCIQTDAAYASEVHMQRILTDGQIKAVLFNSGLLDTERFYKTGYFIHNYIFTRCGCAYFGCKKGAENEKMMQASLLRHVTADYPPVFISDGNWGSFTDQAENMAALLERLGVKHELNIYPRKEKRLGHNYEQAYGRYSIDNMNKMIGFLKETIS